MAGFARSGSGNSAGESPRLPYEGGTLWCAVLASLASIGCESERNRQSSAKHHLEELVQPSVQQNPPVEVTKEEEKAGSGMQ